ncbi:enoyl-CoA hydratase-related protein [Sphingobium nicotianae]|uniref:Enoyl-CoA hydratase/isomerase family protein n=1 Tax=Sphingobium nicotianae TaxID=2782607 RepID=A0A9X1DD20_9SPHN|nr:enoyl-CoA hydratase-related protein [Sphingobium nicotianae]MBT2187655.1 enoyl-CoA hydratase/isomerase family protein [Sphingobium nicotianae]
MSEVILQSALDEGVLTLTLDRQTRLNALSTDLLAGLLTALDEGVAAGARAVLITGAGRAFCSGADLAGDGGVTADLGDTLTAYYHPLFDRIAALDIPVVSAVNGPAVGAGVALALAADIVVMARSAYLQLGFVNIGLVPDAGATWLIAKSAGRAKALEMALLGEQMTAQQAQDAGLVARVVDDSFLLPDALAIARKLAAGPTIAIGLIRKQVAAALNQTLAETMEQEAGNQTRAGRTADFLEGVTAFVQKRPPIFRGQ